jgi:hypothetical protein
MEFYLLYRGDRQGDATVRKWLRRPAFQLIDYTEFAITAIG